jgi:hypothetical protein
MYLSVVFVYAIILVLASPIIWVAWWLLADIGEHATASQTTVRRGTNRQSRRQVA